MSFCDFIAGWAGGVLGLVTGHPFDTIKVNQQTKGIGVIQCAGDIYRSHGVKGYFRGLAFPLLANGALNSVFFGVYGHTIERIMKYERDRKAEGRWSDLENNKRHSSFRPRTTTVVEMEKAKVEHIQASYLHCLLGGLVGGMAQLIVACPVEVVKIKLQTSRAAGFHGPLQIVTNILSTQGPRGLYQGIGVMTLRDTPSFGIYMFLYTALSDGLRNWHIFTDDGVPNSFRTVIAGGVAGTISWWSIIPLDVIKSRLQADDPQNPRYKGIRDCARAILKAQGYKGLVRGFWTMSLRAFPVNGATFLAYEWIDWTCHSLTGNKSQHSSKD